MLTTRKNGMVSKNEMLSTFNKRFLKLSNWTDREIEALGDLSVLEEAKLQELIERKSKERFGLNNGNGQKVIMLPELEKHISEGWEYVTTFNTDKAIVRIPKGR
jgi:hypothetical protein